MDEKEKKEIGEIFKHHIGILSEDFQHKLDIVVKGHQLLNGKIDRLQEGQTELTKRVERIELTTLRLDQRQERLEQGQSNLEHEIKKTREDLIEKIDTVAADLSAHRADTEIHQSIAKTRK